MDAHGYRYNETNLKMKTISYQDKNLSKTVEDRTKDKFVNTMSRQKAETNSHKSMNQNKGAFQDFVKEGIRRLSNY